MPASSTSRPLLAKWLPSRGKLSVSIKGRDGGPVASPSGSMSMLCLQATVRWYAHGNQLDDVAGADAQTFLEHLRQAEAASRTRKAAATMGGSITNTDALL